MAIVGRLAIPFFLLVYLINFFLMNSVDGFPMEEAMGAFIVLCCIFSPIAYFISRKSEPAPRVGPNAGEGYLITGLFVYISIVLMYGSKIVFMLFPSLPDSPLNVEIVAILFKVTVFVILPFLLYKRLYGFGTSNFGIPANLKSGFANRHLVIFGVMATMFTLLQWFGGRAAAPIRDGEFSTMQLAVGLPLAFAWLLIEAGLVEEFFFRALLQDRLSALLRSEWWAIAIASLLFGLAHAPGMYFRGAGSVEGLGTSPSFLTCAGYCIAVQSAAGIPFAIIWSKTRNLWLVMAIHASVDLLSNAPSLIRAWGL